MSFKGGSMFKNFKPLGDRVLVKRIENEDVTAGGIIIPDAAKERAQTGKVIAVGEGRVDAQGKIVPMHVKIGDKIYFGKYSGTEVGEDYLIIREEDILGIIE
jgi:chaperonin GroES